MHLLGLLDTAIKGLLIRVQRRGKQPSSALQYRQVVPAIGQSGPTLEQALIGGNRFGYSALTIEQQRFAEQRLMGFFWVCLFSHGCPSINGGSRKRRAGLKLGQGLNCRNRWPRGTYSPTRWIWEATACPSSIWKCLTMRKFAFSILEHGTRKPGR